MGSERLRHDVALATAHALLEMACGLLMELEKPGFHDECYAIVYAALQSYDEHIQRLVMRAEPSRN